MLEIGLGCGMSYGPGKSYDTWLESSPNLVLYYIEYDAWKHEADRATVLTGDQADRESSCGASRPRRAATSTSSSTTAGTSWRSSAPRSSSCGPCSSPGAVYFVEDLQTSFMAYFGDDVAGGKDPGVPTTTKFIYELIDDKMLDGTRHAISKEMRGIDCMREICCFQKRSLGLSQPSSLGYASGHFIMFLSNSNPQEAYGVCGFWEVK